MFTLQKNAKPLLLFPLEKVTVNNKEENSLKTFVPIASKNSASGGVPGCRGEGGFLEPYSCLGTHMNGQPTD